MVGIAEGLPGVSAGTGAPIQTITLAVRPRCLPKYTPLVMYVKISCDSVNPATLSLVQMKSVYVSNACCWSKQDLTNLTLFVFKAS